MPRSSSLLLAAGLVASVAAGPLLKTPTAGAATDSQSDVQKLTEQVRKRQSFAVFASLLLLFAMRACCGSSANKQAIHRFPTSA